MTQVALVTWTESVGLTLVHRDLSSMHLKTPYGQILVFNILQIFPFTSETKRMGIILRVIITTLMTMDSLLFFLQLLLTLRLPPYLKFLTLLFFPGLQNVSSLFLCSFYLLKGFPSLTHGMILSKPMAKLLILFCFGFVGLPCLADILLISYSLVYLL